MVLAFEVIEGGKSIGYVDIEQYLKKLLQQVSLLISAPMIVFV